MHTILVLGGGFLLLGLCLAIGHVTGAGLARASLLFLPLWLIATGYNLWYGVANAGYSVAEELPIFALLFIVPAAVAMLVRRRYIKPT